MVVPTTTCRLSSSRPQVAIGPMLATNPSAATTVSAGTVVVWPVVLLVMSTDRSAPVLAADGSDLARRVQLDPQVAHLVHHRAVRPELLAPVHDPDAAGDRVQHRGPVERRVAAADDDDVLVAVLLQAGHEEDQPPAPQPAPAGIGRE